MKSDFTLSGNIVDVVKQRVYQGIINVVNGKISHIEEQPVDETHYVIPGLIDAHVHIESSMVTPARFAQKAVVHGTVATVSDPHEIANVLGMDGIRFMIDNGKETPFKFFFGAPSCVPATSFESAGAVIDSKQVEQLLQIEDIYYLAEMMNFPGVVYNDAEVWAKLNAAKAANKPVDGHAPGLQGDDLEKYAQGGITTDHECMNVEEAMDKIRNHIKVQIREGSAAKNFDELLPLVETHPEMVMFCSDDKHPDELAKGHINLLLRRAIAKGHDPLTLLRICSKNVVDHYRLPVGLLQSGDAADMVVVDNLTNFNVLSTYIDGIKVAENGNCLFEVHPLPNAPNQFNASRVEITAIQVADTYDKVKVIQVEDGQLYTRAATARLKGKNGYLHSDTGQDVLKIVVLNRYQRVAPAVSFITGIGLQQGAMASSIAHDSHNIVAVGTNDEDLVAAINLVIDHKGGISACSGPLSEVLPLPVAGIMSNDSVEAIAEKYLILSDFAKYLGTPLTAPFMTLAFMSLLVIPELKLG